MSHQTAKRLIIGLVVVLGVLVIAAGGGVSLAAFGLPALCLYLCYRIVRGGFTRSQSAKLNAFGWIGCVVLILVALAVLQWGLERLGLN
jgi:hypothetical protein